MRWRSDAHGRTLFTFCRLMGYISAVAERCYERSTETCSNDPYCTVVRPLYPQQLDELQADPITWLKQHGETDAALDAACRPDFFRVLSKPCKGSRGDLLVRCGGYNTAGLCSSDPSCIWLR